jgi:hypothetical protein
MDFDTRCQLKISDRVKSATGNSFAMAEEWDLSFRIKPEKPEEPGWNYPGPGGPTKPGY